MSGENKVSLLEMTNVKEPRGGAEVILERGVYEFWFEAIQKDDLLTVKTTLSNADADERVKLLNGVMEFSRDEYPANFFPERPIWLAAMYGSGAVLREFLENSTDVCQVDSGKHNIIHALIYMAYLDSDLEDSMTRMYNIVRENSSEDTIETLLHTDNFQGLRPLELATNLGTFQLMLAIWETKFVYLVKEEVSSIYCRKLYEITDYETSVKNGGRSDRSPLLFMSRLEERKLGYQSVKQAFTHPALKQWISAKLNCNIPFLVVWFLFRCVFVFSFFMLMTYKVSCSQIEYYRSDGLTLPNDSCVIVTIREYQHINGTTLLKFFAILLHVFTGAILLFDLVDMAFYFVRKRRQPWRYRNPDGRPKVLTSHTFVYRVGTFMLVMLVCVSSPLAVAWHYSSSVRFIADAHSILEATLCTWSLCFFLELLPMFGPFLGTMIPLIGNVSRFSVFYLALSLPFAYVFSMLINDVKDLSAPCPEQFQNLLRSCYSTFSIMLNIIDVEEYEVQDRPAVLLLHFLYISIIAILLLNFLIALLSNSVSELWSNIDVSVAVQRLSAVVTVEARMTCVFSWAYAKFREQYFHINEDRIYLKVDGIDKSTIQTKSQN